MPSPSTIAILAPMERPPLERIQRGLAHFNRGEYASSIALLSPAIQWDTTDAVPDGRLYSGREEVLGFWSGMPDRWDDFRIEAERWVDGGEVVLMLGRLEALGADSGVPVRNSWDQVWRIAGDEVVRCENYINRAKAWDAAGLEPQDS
jgi:ketosteroid isomerase-like protein